MRGTSLLFSAACVAYLFNHFARPALLHGWITTWNNTAQFGVFLVIAALVDALRRRVMRESYERRLAVDQLRHADRLNTIGMLAAGIAHELGTSLNIVLGQAQLIESGRAIGEDAKVSARSIISRSERMSAIIRQLLDFGRRSGKGRRRAKLIDLAADTANLLGKMARDHKVRIEVVPTEADTTVFVNVSEIEQVVSNLVVNAIQSMPRGGRVVVSGGLEDHPTLSKDISCTWLSIEDEGEGIVSEHIEHIFDPFFTTKPVGEGTGLGLSVAYGIVADHGGWFTVNSKPGKGSRFAIHFPTQPLSGDSSRR